MNEIPDYKKAAILVLSNKYGHRAIAKRLDISKNTAKKYRDIADEEGHIEMNGTNLKVKAQ